MANGPQRFRVAVLECAAKAHGLPKLSGNRSDSGATTAAIWPISGWFKSIGVRRAPIITKSSFVFGLNKKSFK